MDLYGLVQELCKVDPAERLPAHGPEYVDNVRHAPTYQKHKFDWAKLKKMDLSLVVYKPEVKALDDTRNFAKVGADELPPQKKYDPVRNPGADGGKWLDNF